ncbi:splicing factor YJU2-like [Punica granatum]|uniref:Splicing factor YJU2 n=1 Tax=Punica granatum TaxID=22663 RepID=A0A218VQ95_PUNGR|nr:splicing factor YJU2-like [Punica granatum]OWM62704.1 hypothetical protein CDL15_Pgr019998 [Punica granatum]
MGERKVLNKYYPPDFDPSKLKRISDLGHQGRVRMMLPMSGRCKACRCFIYAGTKFNSRMEIAGDYLGIKVFRFYFKFTNCLSEFTVKTDPKNLGYTVETGVTRSFEPGRMEDEEANRVKRKRVAEEAAVGDVMKSLENRARESKRKMDVLAALDEIKSLNSRHAKVSVDKMLENLWCLSAEKEVELEKEDEALVKSILFHISKGSV